MILSFPCEKGAGGRPAPFSLLSPAKALPRHHISTNILYIAEIYDKVRTSVEQDRGMKHLPLESCDLTKQYKVKAL